MRALTGGGGGGGAGRGPCGGVRRRCVGLVSGLDIGLDGGWGRRRRIGRDRRAAMAGRRGPAGVGRRRCRRPAAARTRRSARGPPALTRIFHGWYGASGPSAGIQKAETTLVACVVHPALHTGCSAPPPPTAPCAPYPRARGLSTRPTPGATPVSALNWVRSTWGPCGTTCGPCARGPGRRSWRPSSRRTATGWARSRSGGRRSTRERAGSASSRSMKRRRCARRASTPRSWCWGRGPRTRRRAWPASASPAR